MKNFAKRAISLLLALAVILGISPVWQLSASAATIGQREDEATGIEINTSDFIALPIEIYDFENDGMLFEFASSQVRNESYWYGDPADIPEIEIGWNFTENGISGVPASDSLPGYNSRNVNRSFLIELHNGTTTGNFREETGLTALRAHRNQTWAASSDDLRENELLTLGNLNGVDKTKARYMVMSYYVGYTSHLNTEGMSVFARTNTTDLPVRLGTATTLQAGLGWTDVIFDLGSNATTWASVGDTLNWISINPITYTGTVNPDIYISHVAFFETAREAELFAREGRAHFVMRDNHAFGLIGESRYNNGSISTATYHRRIGDAFVYAANGESYVSEYGWVEDDSILVVGNTDTDLDDIEQFLGYNLEGVPSGASVTAGLLNHSLNADGNPTYQKNTVSFVANLLKFSLETPAYDYTTKMHNYHYVMGYKDERFGTDAVTGNPLDLAQAIRLELAGHGNALGSYTDTETRAANLIGEWSDCKSYVQTYHDAAYYLLNNIFIEGAYSTKDNTFETLRMSGVDTDADDEIDYYIFDGGFATSMGGTSATKYDTAAKSIYNTASVAKARSYYGPGSGELTTTFPFLPLVNSNNAEGQTYIPYFADDGARNSTDSFNTYANRDYNFIMKSSGQFAYDYDDDLFFEFEGDDDVYLFINGELVLDCGAAHPIATQRIEINDYVDKARSRVNPKIETLRAEGMTEDEIEAFMLETEMDTIKKTLENLGMTENEITTFLTGFDNGFSRDYKLALVDGNAYSFDFFYMERKGYGANLRIMTNMKVSATEIDAGKTAYQSGTEIQDGGSVSYGTPVEYAFSVTNNDDNSPSDYNDSKVDDDTLLNLVFSDDTLGITLNYANANGIVCTTDKTHKFYDNWYKADGTRKIQPSDLTFILTNDKTGKEVSRFTPANADELVKYLKAPGAIRDANNNYVEGKGVPVGHTLTVRGICVNLASTDFTNSIFQNYVAVYCNSDYGQQLSASDSFKLRHVEALIYYQWAKHPITTSADELKEYINNAITFNEEAGDYEIITITDMYVSDASGNKGTSEHLSFDDSYNLTIKHAAIGNCLDYIHVIYEDTQSNADELTVPIATNVFDVEDDVFVLDYGLSVDLTEDSALLNDMNTIAGNTNIVEGISGQDPAYVEGIGENRITFDISVNETNFSYSGGSVIYRPNSFMENAENIYVAVRAYKDGSTPSPIGSTNIKTEVEMYKTVTVLPANVVYYEDDFPAIVYNTAESGNRIVSDGTGLTESTQAADLLLDFNDNSIPAQSVYNQATDIEIANGALTYTVGAENHNLYLSGGHNIAGSMNFVPTDNMYCQIRFKVDGATVDATNDNIGTDGTNYAGSIRYTLYAIDSAGAGIGYKMNNIPLEYVDGKYYTYTYKLDSNWTNVNPVTGVRLNFNHITIGAKVTVDYVFVGNAADLPAKGWETLMQDNDQDDPYGSDSHYQGNSNDYSGTGYHKIQITQTSLNKPDAHFTFAGTGFEIIGRTNATDSATIYVRVKNKDGKQVKLIPVITEFDHGGNGGKEEIYQVPVIRVDDLKFEDGPYTVEIIGVTAYKYDENGQFVYDNDGNRMVVDTFIYIDGIRIYNPLGTSTLTDNYNDSEKNATFKEIRELIMGNQMAAVKLEGNNFSINMNEYGYTENRTGTAYDSIDTYTGHATLINDYLVAGPNNELYLSSETGKQGIVMYVKETGTGAHSLQVAMRWIDANAYNGFNGTKAEAAKVYLGTTGTSGNLEWTAIDEGLISGTEQYYNIDYTQCPTSGGYYQVVIALSPEAANASMVSFTSVKYVGLDFKASTGNEAGIRFENGRVFKKVTGTDANSILEDTYSIQSQETTETEWIELTDEEAAQYMNLPLIAEQMRSTTIVDPTLANRNGIYEVDGELYYFVNGKIYNSVGLVKLGGKFYYVRTSGKIAIGEYWVTNTNGLMPEGYYFFGEDGAMIVTEDVANGIVEENGNLFYYVDGEIQYGAGLIQLDGSYYYIRSGGQAAVGVYWVTNTNGLMPEGFYTFGADGKMILEQEAAKNGIVEENGGLFYYVDGKIQYGAGLILLDGNYYYIRSGGHAAIGLYWVTNTNGLLHEGFYTFGESGQMIDPPTV